MQGFTSIFPLSYLFWQLSTNNFDNMGATNSIGECSPPGSHTLGNYRDKSLGSDHKVFNSANISAKMDVQGFIGECRLMSQTQRLITGATLGSGPKSVDFCQYWRHRYTSDLSKSPIHDPAFAPIHNLAKAISSSRKLWIFYVIKRYCTWR